MGDVADFSFLKNLWPFLLLFILSIVFLHILRSGGKRAFYMYCRFFLPLSAFFSFDGAALRPVPFSLRRRSGDLRGEYDEATKKGGGEK